MAKKYADIYEALFVARAKAAKAVKMSNNSEFNSTYADLNSVMDAVLPALTSCGILLMQPETYIDGKLFVKTTLRHIDTGSEISCEIEAVAADSLNMQAIGSAITYARRYGLVSLCALSTMDDDARSAKTSSPGSQIYEEIAKATSVEELTAIYQREKETTPDLNGLLLAIGNRKKELA